jgi:hypothetical protein
MLDGRAGLKNAVLFMQSGAVDGFFTICASATVASASSGAPAITAFKACKALISMAPHPPVILPNTKRQFFIGDRKLCARVGREWAGARGVLRKTGREFAA